MRLVSTALLIAALATPAFADARLAQNGLRVEFRETQFEVFTKAGWSREALFCAAGDVARMRGAAANDYLVVTQGVGTSTTNPRRRSAVFELVDRSQVADRSVFTFLSGFKPGARMSVGSAVFACEQDDFLRNGI
ncbi:hypothetical protein [Cognatishimia sp. MH4019]|uniref:hypothetical protein n=1 Tax=Cognatishimia sp. MH4019 TaxID=2854030 RepID=UPI001CD704DE|nr:hypothetical protein [Cognatishimia sp. MH4019]